MYLPRARVSSLDGNIAGIVDGVGRFNKLGGGLDIANFLNDFDWTNMGVGQVNVGSLTLKSLDDGKVGLFRNGQRIDDAAIRRAMREGDLLRSIKEMKFSYDVHVADYAKGYQAAFKNGAGYKAGKYMDTYKHSSMPQPTSFPQLEAMLKADRALEVRLTKKLDEMEAKVNPSTGRLDVGKWLKRAVVVGLGGLSLAWFFQQVSKHQQLMNGCWLVHYTSQDKVKCKLPIL